MWSIGIKTGNSPLCLTAPSGSANPVLSASSVTDVPAEFVADPFMVRARGSWHMFFEVMRADTRRGEIALATSDDALSWTYARVVLRESFHLSYPYVFEFRNDYFLAPETRRLGCVQIFRSDGFPDDWRPCVRLPAIGGADPSFFEHDGRLWMFICPDHFHSLRLYSAIELEGPWMEHPRSPIVQGDASRARPAGRVINYNGRLFRFAQDCAGLYGACVRAFEITELSANHYAEIEVPESPVTGPSGEGWDGERGHHIDAHCLGPDSWIACVDGHPLSQTAETGGTPSHSLETATMPSGPPKHR